MRPGRFGVRAGPLGREGCLAGYSGRAEATVDAGGVLGCEAVMGWGQELLEDLHQGQVGPGVHFAWLDPRVWPGTVGASAGRLGGNRGLGVLACSCGGGLRGFESEDRGGEGGRIERDMPQGSAD